MAKRLDAFPEDLQVRSTEAYPWDEWFDGAPWELRRGEDYVVKTKSFVSNAQAKARKRGGTLRTATLPKDEGVVIQYRVRAMGEVTEPVKNPPASLVRTWARNNGWPNIGEKGVLSADVLAAYQAANQ